MGFLIVDTVWFWLLLIATGIGIILSIEYSTSKKYSRDGGGLVSTLIVILAFILYYALGSKQDIIDLFTYIRDYPFTIIYWSLLYLVFGIAYSFVKWYLYLLKAKQNHINEQKAVTHPLSLHIPSATYNKNKLISWMIYWPFSLLWTIIDEPILKICRFIYSRFSGMYDRLANAVFADLTKNKDNSN